jgi:hypothetical protein
MRSHRDVAEVAEEVRKYALPAGATKVYVIGTGLARDKGGFPIVLRGLLDYWKSKVTTTVTQRSPNDALRLAGILCDPEERESVQRIMSNKKSARPQADQPDDTFTAYFVSILVKFKDATYIVDRPANVEKIKGYESFDANDVSVNLIYELFLWTHSHYDPPPPRLIAIILRAGMASGSSNFGRFTYVPSTEILSSGGFQKRAEGVETYGISKTIVEMRDGLPGCICWTQAAHSFYVPMLPPFVPTVFAMSRAFLKKEIGMVAALPRR